MMHDSYQTAIPHELKQRAELALLTVAHSLIEDGYPDWEDVVEHVLPLLDESAGRIGALGRADYALTVRGLRVLVSLGPSALDCSVRITLRAYADEPGDDLQLLASLPLLWNATGGKWYAYPDGNCDECLNEDELCDLVAGRQGWSMPPAPPVPALPTTMRGLMRWAWEG